MERSDLEEGRILGRATLLEWTDADKMTVLVGWRSVSMERCWLAEGTLVRWQSAG